MIQGREMSFSGFMVEFLGYTGAFMRELPQLHLTKGLYTYSFDEPPFKESFLAELYPEEADRLQHFVSSKHPPLPSLPYSPPTSPYLKSEELLSKAHILCSNTGSTSSQNSGSVIYRGKTIEGGYMSRHIYEQA